MPFLRPAVFQQSLYRVEVAQLLWVTGLACLLCVSASNERGYSCTMLNATGACNWQASVLDCTNLSLLRAAHKRPCSNLHVHHASYKVWLSVACRSRCCLCSRCSGWILLSVEGTSRRCDSAQAASRDFLSPACGVCAVAMRHCCVQLLSAVF